MSKRLTLAPNAFFCVVSCNGMCSRTVAKRPQKTVDGPGPGTSLGIIDLGEIFEFPITNDARRRFILRAVLLLARRCDIKLMSHQKTPQGSWCPWKDAFLLPGGGKQGLQESGKTIGV